MVTTRLEINDISQPFGVNIPVVLTFNLADVREPDKRKATFSKTIQLPATNAINKVFENIFEVNIATQYFNKNIKTPCKYFVNDLLNFSGDLKLSKIILNPDNSIVYEVNVIGEGGTLFVNVGEKLIAGNADSSEDLDFSAYNHTYNRATQISSRTAYTDGINVRYPFIDRGTNGGSDTVFNTTDFLPCFHLYEYILKIITKAGYTFTSSILSGAEFKKYLLYPNISSLALSSAQLANRQFYVGLTADLTLPLAGTFYQINHDLETAPFFDVGGQNNTGTSIVTLNETGFYNMVGHDKFQFSFTHTDPTVTYCVFSQFSKGMILSKSANGGASYFPLSATVNHWNGLNANTFNVSTNYTDINELATGEQQFSAGDKFYKETYFSGFITYYNASSVQVGVQDDPAGTPVIKLLSGSTGTSFYALATQKNVLAGNALLANNCLPIKMKQKDVLKSVFQALNLYVEVDPLDENNLIIESFDEFYNTITPVNFENKTDESKEQTINPNLLEGKRYIYAYKPDLDKYNVLYQSDFNEVFGTETIDVENDFIKSDKKNELIFSATPNVANYGLGIAHPRIYKEDGGLKKTITPNIRWLYCGGVKQSVNPITYRETGQTDLISYDYLYAGHTDDPFNPTIDLNFGLAKRVDYNFIGAYFTTNNFYNRFHKHYLETITDRDSKIVTKWIYWNPKNINEFTFRARLFNDGAYWIVNKIDNYNALEESSTLTELIKLNKSNVFVPSQILISDSTTVSAGSETYSAKLNSSLNVGSSIQNKGSNCIAVGENIIIPESCSNITVIGNNVTVAEDLSNVSVINTNDVDITTSGTNYISGVLTAVWNHLYSSFLKITASGAGAFSINLDNTHSTIACNCALNTIDIYLPDPATVYTTDLEGMGTSKIYTILKIDNVANNVTINPYASETINGASYKTLTTQYQTIRVQTDGVDWFIID